MSSESCTPDEAVFQTGQEIRVLSVGNREMAVPEEYIAAVKEINDRQSAKCLQQASVRLKDLAGFWADLTEEFVGPLSRYDRGVLKKMILPVMIPKGIGLSELPDSEARSLVVLSAGNWHGVILCSQVHEQPILLGHFSVARNGDVAGEIMLVSQFTLHASTKKGNRPSYIKAAPPEKAIPLYESFIAQMELDLEKPLVTGEFGAYMQVNLTNDGPVTILIDTKNKE